MSIEDIRKRLDDAIKNGTDADINYWRGYLDAALVARDAQPNEPLTPEEIGRIVDNYTYCIAKDCECVACERHPSLLVALKEGDKLHPEDMIKIADFRGTCREYIGQVLGEITKEEPQ